MPFTHHSFSIRSPFVQYSLTVRSPFPTYSFKTKTFQGLKKNVEISDVMRNKKVFYTTAVANKKRDMFVVLYFNWHDDIIHKAMASEANTKWRGGVGGKSKKKG